MLARSVHPMQRHEACKILQWLCCCHIHSYCAVPLQKKSLNSWETQDGTAAAINGHGACAVAAAAALPLILFAAVGCPKRACRQFELYCHSLNPHQLLWPLTPHLVHQLLLHLHYRSVVCKLSCFNSQHSTAHQSYAQGHQRAWQSQDKAF